MGDFVEVASPILAGVAGAVHIGSDTGLIALKVQRAIGQQVYLISIIFVVGILAAIWLVGQAARPVDGVLAFAVKLAQEREAESAEETRSCSRAMTRRASLRASSSTSRRRWIETRRTGSPQPGGKE